ncbi:MAG: STM3941 family protein [Flavobacteriales bacterium]
MFYDQDIQLKKTKALILITSALVLLLMSAGIYVYSQTEVHGKQNVLIIETAAIAGIIFFALCTAYGVSRLFKTKTGLSINSMGFTDQSSFMAVGFVSWTDVTALKIIEIKKQKLIAVLLNNPQVYINQATGIKKLLMKINNKLYQSPVLIPAGLLDISFDELAKLFNDHLNRYSKKHGFRS